MPPAGSGSWRPGIEENHSWGATLTTCKYVQPAPANSFSDALEPHATAGHTISYFPATSKYYLYMNDNKVYETADPTSAEATWTLRSSPGAGTVYAGGVKIVCKYDSADPKDRLVHYYTRLDGGQYYAELKWSTDGVNWTTVTSNALGYTCTASQDAMYLAAEYDMVLYDSTNSLTKFYRLTTKASVTTGFQYISRGFIFFDLQMHYFYQVVNGGACQVWSWRGQAVGVAGEPILEDTITSGPTGAANKNFLFGGRDFSESSGKLPPSSTDSYLLVSSEKMMRKTRNAWTGVSINGTATGCDVSMAPGRWADTTASYGCYEIPRWANLYKDIGAGTDWDRYTYRLYPGNGVKLIKYERVADHARDPADCHCGDTYMHEKILTAVGAGDSTETLKQFVGTAIHGSLELKGGDFIARKGTLVTKDAISVENGEALILTDDAGAEIIHADVQRGILVPGDQVSLALTGVEASDLAEEIYEDYSAATATIDEILRDIVARYCRHMYPGTLTVSALKPAWKFAGTTLSGVLMLAAQAGNCSVDIAGDGALSYRAAAASGIALTETSIGECLLEYMTTRTPVILRGGITGGIPLVAVAHSTVYPSGQAFPAYAGSITDQTTLNTHAAAVLTTLESSTYMLHISGAKTTTCPVAGQSVTVQYNLDPVLLAAPTAEVVTRWTWDERLATLDTTDAGTPYPSGGQSIARHGPEVIANWVASPSLGGDLDPDGHGITGETIAPVRGLFGWGGWTDGGSCWYVQCNDNDADIMAIFHVKNGGSFKVVFRFDVNNLDETQVGHLFVGNRQAGEACSGYATYDLIDGAAAFDLNPNGARVDTDQKSAAITIENDSIVTVKWHKDGAGTIAHYLDLAAIYLQRQ
jgi:hypothetical protein